MKTLNRIVRVGGLALLLSAPVAMAQRYDRDYGYQQNQNHISVTGHVTRVVPERAGYRVYLDENSYSYFVPSNVIAGRNLRVGDNVRVGGYLNGSYVTVDAYDPYYNNGYNNGIVRSNGVLGATVVGMNRRLGYLDVREDATGNIVRIDVRNMNVRRSVDVWDLRRGDHIAVRGAWERDNVFKARRID